MKEAIKKVNIFTIFGTTPVILIDGYLDYFVQGDFILGNNAHYFIFLLIQVLSYALISSNHLRMGAGLTIFSFYFTFLLFPLTPWQIYAEPFEDLFISFCILIPLLVLPVIIYDLKRDKTIITGSIIVIFLTSLLMMYQKLQSLAGTDESVIATIILQQPLLLAGYYLSVFTIFFIVINFRRRNIRYQLKLEKSSRELMLVLNRINDQRDKLEIQKNKLLEMQQELISLNSGLEKQITRESNKIATRNKVLTRYGFMNATLLRKPVESLIERFQQKDYELNELKRQISELDDLSSDFSELLNETNFNAFVNLEHKLAAKYNIHI